MTYDRPVAYYREAFTPEEVRILTRFFTNTDRPVFALINLPEVVKGALFARYSRSAKSVRRLFLDEFVADAETGIASIASRLDGDDALVDMRRAEDLYQKVFFEYGDDSVAQLGGTHLACEQASNVLTKVLEWGRLAAYLEQSTRYIAYDAKLGDGYRYLVPPELENSPLRQSYVGFMEELFDRYSGLVADMHNQYRLQFPKQESDSQAVWSAAIRAKACDAARGLLPASTTSNLGIYGSGQTYELLLMRMQASPLAEVRTYGALMLEELRKVIPSFLTRVDKPDRGERWSTYFGDIAQRLQTEADATDYSPGSEPWSVTLTDFDPDAETKIAAAALYAFTETPDTELMRLVTAMSMDQRSHLLAAAIGDRSNRRHKPGRAFERTTYRFDVVCDFGAFRDLQRHRMMTIEWQRISTRLGFDTPADIESAGHGDLWRELMAGAADLYERIRTEYGPDVAQYAAPFASHIRFVMEMNPRQAFHLLELRSQPAGHVAYRRIAQEMHRQIAEVAGHRTIANAMRFVDHSGVDLERLEAERAAERRRLQAGD